MDGAKNNRQKCRLSRKLARFAKVKAMTTVRKVDLVVPLAHKATAMRTTDTAGLAAQGWSGAVSPLTDRDGRQGDVDSTNKRSTLPTLNMPGTRISTTATRTTTTRVTKAALAPSADEHERHHADFVLEGHCNGCRNCWYSKPSHDKGTKFSWQSEVSRGPHVRCLYFKDDIRIVIEMKRGCDGRNSPKIVGYELPRNCPEVLKRAQGSLF
jgi:hypothetical protein